MSEIKVNKITPRVACGTTQLGDSGDTITIPSGATITNLGTATGFGGTGVVSWETSSIKTTGFTAVTGTGYFCNTTGGAFTVTLPLSPSAGDVVGVADYAKTFDTDNLTLGRNGSNIGGGADDSVISTEGIAVTLVYVDGTKGWIVTDSGLATDAPGPLYIAASGGCITTCGNFKMHTFLSPNTFTVSCGGNAIGSTTVDYMVIAGGGSGGTTNGAQGAGGGGGGAGGYRESSGAASGCYTVSPLGSGVTAVTVGVQSYTVTVGGGGTTETFPQPGSSFSNPGSDSSFDTITSSGGGGGTNYVTLSPGGSGGGYGNDNAVDTPTGGVGNIPVVSPAQGTNGGGSTATPTFYGAGGGGGAITAGSKGTACIAGGGGPGATSSITGSPVQRAGGGGGGTYGGGPGTGGPAEAAGGGGGGGTGSSYPKGDNSTAGGINTGGGGGGTGSNPAGALNYSGKAGGSGIVIIRYRYQ